MKKLLFIHLLALFIFLPFSSCIKNSPPFAIVKITVVDGNSWAPTNTTMNLVSGATVKLYNTQTEIINNAAPTYTATTDQTGNAVIPVAYKSAYFFTAEKGNAKNVINDLLIIGIFQTQAEIQASAFQIPFPTIGSPKFSDTNGDGKIDASDKIYADYIDLIQGQIVSKTSIIYQTGL